MANCLWLFYFFFKAFLLLKDKVKSFLKVLQATYKRNTRDVRVWSKRTVFFGPVSCMDEMPCLFRYSSILSSSMESTGTLRHSFWNSGRHTERTVVVMLPIRWEISPVQVMQRWIPVLLIWLDRRRSETTPGSFFSYPSTGLRYGDRLWAPFKRISSVPRS